MEVAWYNTLKSMLEENIQNTFSLVLGKCNEFLKRNSSRAKGGAKHLQNFMSPDIIKIIKLTTLKFEDQKYLPIFLHQLWKIFHNLHQGNISNAKYLETFNNLVYTAYE